MNFRLCKMLKNLNAHGFLFPTAMIRTYDKPRTRTKYISFSDWAVCEDRDYPLPYRTCHSFSYPQKEFDEPYEGDDEND